MFIPDAASPKSQAQAVMVVEPLVEDKSIKFTGELAQWPEKVKLAMGMGLTVRILLSESVHVSEVIMVRLTLNVELLGN